MPNRPPIHLGVLRHGAFSKMLILPWEEPQEFEKLYNNLVDEWKPVGPTEYDAVLTIAKGVWRKRRIQYCLSEELLESRVDPDHPAYDRATALHALSKVIKFAPDEFDRALNGLPADIAEELRQKFPREKFQSVSEWVDAIQKEIASVLLPTAERFNGFPGMIIGLRDTAFFTAEVVKNELAVDERIDAMIDRAVKRLVQTKAMKQMLSSPSLNKGVDQPKELRSNKGNGSTKVARSSPRPSRRRFSRECTNDGDS
jgi:hypothetical protein